MANVTGAVKESLLGKEAPADLSSESRNTFLRLAKKDEDGELYMNEEDFINAIAPPEEDYVSRSPCPSQVAGSLCPCRHVVSITDAAVT
jgi:hypothetical protein